jgi:hypothetical protein
MKDNLPIMFDRLFEMSQPAYSFNVTDVLPRGVRQFDSGINYVEDRKLFSIFFTDEIDLFELVMAAKDLGYESEIKTEDEFKRMFDMNFFKDEAMVQMHIWGAHAYGQFTPDVCQILDKYRARRYESKS